MTTADYTISIPLDNEELRSLKGGGCLSLVFRTMEDVDTSIRVYIEHADKELLSRSVEGTDVSGDMTIMNGHLYQEDK